MNKIVNCKSIRTYLDIGIIKLASKMIVKFQELGLKFINKLKKANVKCKENELYIIA